MDLLRNRSTSSWTSKDVPDLSDQTYLVTGANRGIGYHVSSLLARSGAHVLMTTRDRERGLQRREKLLAEVDEGTLDVVELDLADLRSVEACTQAVTDRVDALDGLCNNAGVMAIPYRETADGFEYQVGVNHLGHFALTGHLLDLLAASRGEARVVTQSSSMHFYGDIDPATLGTPPSYDRWQAYANSKLANLLFAYELERRLRTTEQDIVSIACHPGYTDTDLQLRGPREGGMRLQLALLRGLNRVVGQSPRRGALPMVYAVTAPAIDGGSYIGPDGLLKLRGYPVEQASDERSRDQDLAENVWQRSVELTGVDYDLIHSV